MGNALEVRGLAKVYVKPRALRDLVLRPLGRAERVTALDGVDLAVRRGEIFGLLGPNGAGKTTLLKILAGLVLPTAGRAEVAGHDVAHADVSVRASIGFVTSEERSFYWRLTGRENLHFFGRLSNVPGPELRRRCAELLEQVELSEAADRRFHSYSSGMKQRLAVARGLLHDPPVLIMDEPTRSLDPAAAQHLRRFVRDELNVRRGKTVLLATHNLDEAESLSHRIAIIHRGRIRRCGTLDEVRAAESPRERYRVEVRPAFEPAAGAYQVIERTEGLAGGRAFTLELGRGGDGLTRFLREALDRGARIVACERIEMPLQEVFERAIADDEQEQPAPAAAGVPW
jgi:ABC-2 type transport system ATP-binding protein